MDSTYFRTKTCEMNNEITSLIQKRHIAPQTIIESVSYGNYYEIRAFAHKHKVGLFILKTSNEWITVKLVIKKQIDNE